MEAAGLAIGIVGLVGAFKDIIDLFALFTASRELGQDCELLETKLDIEKAILLRWAMSVKLLSPDYDPRLDDPHLPLVPTLMCIRRLLSDTSELRQRYGLSGVPIAPAAPVIERSATIDLGSASLTASSCRSTSGSAPLMERFTQDFAAFQIRTLGESGRKPSAGARFRWVIRDKEKFEDLVKNLGYFNAKLQQLVPVTIQEPGIPVRSPGPKRPLGEDAVDADVSVPKRIKEWSPLPLPGYSATTSEEDSRISERILRRLWFRTIHDRRQSVADAHNKTFKWALEHSAGRPWDDLPEWLLSKSGVGIPKHRDRLQPLTNNADVLDLWQSRQWEVHPHEIPLRKRAIFDPSETVGCRE